MGDKEHCNPLLLVSLCVSGGVGGVAEIAGVLLLPRAPFSWTYWLNPNSKLFRLLHLFLKSSIRQNAHSECAIKTLWLGLRVLEAFVFVWLLQAHLSEQVVCIWRTEVPTSLAYADSKYLQPEEKTELIYCLGSALTLWGNLRGEQVEF